MPKLKGKAALNHILNKAKFTSGLSQKIESDSKWQNKEVGNNLASNNYYYAKDGSLRKKKRIHRR